MNSMLKLSSEQLEVVNLIFNTLKIDNVNIADIHPDCSLFRDGLGLDSIDILELVLAIKQKYGLQIQANNTQNIQIFSTVANLTDYIQQSK